MIKLINESLFRQHTEGRQGERGEFFLTSFVSAVKTPDPRNRGAKAVKKIATIIHSEEDNFNQENTRISMNRSKNGYPTMHIGQGSNNKYDTTVYLIAIPYSGMMAPLEKSHEYRIYKGLTVRAEKRTIEFDGKKYNKIAFLAVVLNESLFKEDSPHHQEQLALTIDTFNLENNGDEKDTIKTTVSIIFTKDQEPSVNTSSEKVDPIDMEEFKGKRVFPIYQGPKGYDKGEKTDSRRDNVEKNEDSSEESTSGSKSLDEMIAEAEKDKTSKMSYKDDYRKSGKKGKNKKRR
jgi:hypothetical protein